MLTLISLLLLYFLPTIIAREKRDFTGIFLLNLFFGWTLIGWLIALVWALSAESDPPVRFVPVGGRFCTQCGTFANPHAHFCTACGRTV